jgi:hypothetical protein
MTDNFGMKEGEKPGLEPCVAEDMDRIGKLNKDALAIFAQKKFNLSIDRGTNISILRGDLVKKVMVALGMLAEDPNINEVQRAAIERVIPQFLRHPHNHRVFVSTPALLLRHDMIPCDKLGNPVHVQQPVVAAKDPASDELARLSLDLERQVV